MDSELEVGKGAGLERRRAWGSRKEVESAWGLALVIGGALGTGSFSAAHPSLLPPIS